jgi:protein-tyrosine-phosphatase/DNA-binding transcriptional ArsR family regulator
LIDLGGGVTVVAVGRTDFGTSGTGPPQFLQLAAHPVRWRLLQELVRSDRAVSELVRRLGESQSLVSYHLRLLREGGLVSARRSSFDGRDSYYAIDLSACATRLQAAGGALHPALSLGPASASRHGGRGRARRVLFLCTGNRSRSQMAEALTVHASHRRVRAASAGSHPKTLHPEAVRTMQRRGIDISAHRTKHLDEFRSQRFDAVVTLCDRVREVCPEFPSHPELVHWSIPEPESRRAFELTARELETRVHFFLARLDAPTGRSRHAQR